MVPPGRAILPLVNRKAHGLYHGQWPVLTIRIPAPDFYLVNRAHGRVEKLSGFLKSGFHARGVAVFYPHFIVLAERVVRDNAVTRAYEVWSHASLVLVEIDTEARFHRDIHVERFVLTD